MSVFVMGLVWTLDLTTNRKIVLLKLADHGNDDGRNVYPGVPRIARECGMSRRTVQVILKEFLADGALVVEKNSHGGRGRHRVFRINVDRLGALYRLIQHPKKGAAPAPFDEERVQPRTLKGAAENVKGCKSSAPEPSITIIEPSAGAREVEGPPKGRVADGTAGAPDRGHALAEAIAVFKTLQPAMAEAVGAEVWSIIGSSLFVLSSSAEHMLLGQPSKFLCDQTRAHCEALGRATNRRIEIIVCAAPWELPGGRLCNLGAEEVSRRFDDLRARIVNKSTGGA